MTRLLLLVLLVVLPVCAQFQRATNGGVVAPTGPLVSDYTGPKGSISGTVVDAITGAPVRKAQVSIATTGPHSAAVTDGSGSFLFDQLPPGSYIVFAHKREYPVMANGLRPPQVSLGPGERKSGIELKLLPGASVSGQVTDDTGDPLAACAVALFLPGQMAQMIANGNTDTHGHYTLTGVSAGRYYLQARCNPPYLQPRPFGPPDALPVGPELGYTAVFYPGVTDFSSAQKLKLSPGQELRAINFRISPEPVTTVSVRIDGFRGEMRTRPFATLIPALASAQQIGVQLAGAVQANGVALIHAVPAGTYQLRVLAAAGGGTLAQQILQVTDQPLAVTVTIHPPIPLAGIVHEVDSPSVAASPARPPARVILSRPDEMGQQQTAALAPDGSFSFPALAFGRYRASLSTGGFVRSVALGAETIDGPEFEIKEGAVGPLQLTVSFAMGTVSGEIDLGDAHPAQILVYATSGMSQTSTSMLTVIPGQPVRYSLSLAPGSYQLYAFELERPDAAARLFGGASLPWTGQEAESRADSPASRNLKLITAAAIEKADL